METAFITNNLKAILDYGVLGILFLIIVLWYMKDVRYYRCMMQTLVVMDKLNSMLKEILSNMEEEKVVKSEWDKNLDKCMEGMIELNSNIGKLNVRLDDMLQWKK